MSSFSDLGLSDATLRAVSDLGFVTPTPVQERIIPVLLDKEYGKDIVCLAQTGTGKTAAFGLPLLEQVDLSIPDTQALVLSPTRELARQICDDLKRYSKYMEGLSVVPVYGGASIEAQIKLLKKGAHIIVATPGRIIDLIERKAADISGIKTLVLDEADEMLNMGFKDELDTILRSAPEQRKTLLFSATLPIEVEKIAVSYMREHEIFTVGTRNSASSNVKHYYFIVQAKDRYNALKRLVDYNPDIYGIVFCRTRQETQDVSDSLIRDGYDADCLHGELSQNQRDQVMKRFRQKNLKLLVATDVAARGLDVNNLSHVINYNLPDDIEQYTHRSGRTGRADKTGSSYVIINVKEQHKIKQIEKMINCTFTKLPVPGGEEVCARQLGYIIDQIDRIEVQHEIDEFMPIIEEKWASLSREDIIRKVLSMEFNRFIEYYRHAPDLNVRDREKEKEKDKGRKSEGRDRKKDKGRRDGKASAASEGKSSGEASGKDGGKRSSGKQDEDFLKPEKGFTWIRISNVGSKYNVTPRHMLRLASACGLGKKAVGRIDIRKDCIYISVASNAAGYFRTELDCSTYRGRRIKADIVNAK